MKMNLCRTLLPLLACACAFTTSGSAQEWTRFRGPNGTGISKAKGIPVKWTEADFVYRVRIPGESHSQPVIWGDKLFVMTALESANQRALVCLDKKTGKELWTKTYSQAPKMGGNKNSGSANTSAVVDAKHVVAMFVSADQFWVRTFDHSGKELWSHNLGTWEAQHGHGASPMIYENMVIVPDEQTGDSFVVAYDLASGKEVWKTTRSPHATGTGYATPIVNIRKDGKPELIVASQAHGVSGLDPKTGKTYWESPTTYKKRIVASPVLAGDIVIATCGSAASASNYLAALKLGGEGDVSTTHLAYTIKTGTPYVPTPLIVGDTMYTVNDSGIACAIEASTGKEIWTERVKAEFFASPVWVDNKIYIPSTKGEMLVLATGNKFELLARNPILEGTHSTPCIDNNRMYIKTFTHLICLGGK